MPDNQANLDEIDSDLPENIPPLVVGISLVYSIVLVVGALWCYFAEIQLLQDTDPQVIALQLAWAVVVGLVLVVAVGIMRRFSTMFDVLEGAVRSRLGDLSRLSVLGVSLLSSVAEELFFRGAIQTSLGQLTGSDVAGLIVTSLLFGFLHMGRNTSYLPWTIFAVGSGLVLGYSFLLTGNILVPILIHFLINGVNMWRIIFAKPARA